MQTPTIEPLLLTAARVSTFDGKRQLTGASGFFFERESRLFLVTSRHVLNDKPSKHFPDRIEIELHTDASNLTRSIGLSVPLYRDGKSLWREGRDAGGEIDVAVIELEHAALPATVELRCFTPAHLQRSLQEVEVGTSVHYYWRATGASVRARFRQKVAHPLKAEAERGSDNRLPDHGKVVKCVVETERKAND